MAVEKSRAARNLAENSLGGSAHYRNRYRAALGLVVLDSPVRNRWLAFIT